MNNITSLSNVARNRALSGPRVCRELGDNLAEYPISLNGSALLSLLQHELRGTQDRDRVI